MARTLPLHSLCIVLTATALTATGMSQSAPGHPGLRRVQQANSGSDNGLDYTTSWIGNTFGGNTTGRDMGMRHVPVDVQDIYVTPDGRVFTNNGWDEGGRPVSVFKDGQLISPLSDANSSPNWSNAGGATIAVDGQYIYAAQSTGVGANPPCAGAGGMGAASTSSMPRP